MLPSRARSKKKKNACWAHHEIATRRFTPTGQEGPPTILPEVLVDEGKVAREGRVDEGPADLVGDHGGEGPDEEGGFVEDGVEDDLEDERGHEGPLGVVHEEGVVELPLLRPRCVPAFAVLVYEVVYDGSAVCSFGSGSKGSGH